LAPRLGPNAAQAIRVATFLAAHPFFDSLLRSGWQMAHAVRVVARAKAPSPEVAPAVETMALLAVVVAAGLPALAIVVPVVGHTWVELLMVALFAGLVGLAARRLGGATSIYTSQVARLAQGLARHVEVEVEVEVDESHTAHEALPALDYTPIVLADDSAAIGRTLAELNLRSRTGTTVLAIRRGDDTAVLPTGHDRLSAHDTLAVSGSDEAVARARLLLQTGELQPLA
jgi:CPA2 family monovalent cation:H+ antiporter-2